jgi:hypothetical protein
MANFIGREQASFPVESWHEILTDPVRCKVVFGGKGFKSVTPMQALEWVQKRLENKHEIAALELLESHLKEIIKASLS